MITASVLKGLSNSQYNISKSKDDIRGNVASETIKLVTSMTTNHTALS